MKAIQIQGCTAEQEADVLRLIEAIAASFDMQNRPRCWLNKHGAVGIKTSVPDHYKQLRDDYKETRKEMEQLVS